MGKMSYCGSQTIATRKSGQAHVYSLRCKRWTCPTCAPRRRKRLIAEALEGQPNRFVTLTVNPHWYGSPEERGRRLVEAWRDYVREFRRLNPTKELHYLAVIELTKLGEPHIHLICRSSRIPQAELSAWMAKRMGAPVVDVRLVRGAREVAKYVSKYISKRPIKLGSLKRYWRSLKYLPTSNAEKRRLRRQQQSVWIIDMDRESYLKVLQRNGKVIFKRFEDDISFHMFEWEPDPPGDSEHIRRLH